MTFQKRGAGPRGPAQYWPRPTKPVNITYTTKSSDYQISSPDQLTFFKTFALALINHNKIFFRPWI